jgi:hypothetical protein
MKLLRRIPLAMLGLFLLAASLPAQVGTTTDIIAGTVLGADGRPLVSADVEAISIETGLRRSTMTNRSGRYTIVFPDGGGRYAVRITHIGLAPQEFLLERLADEDVLIADARMAVRAIAIEGIDVVAQRADGEGERVEAGALEAAYTQEYLNRLPLEPGDFDAIAALTSGVLPVDGDDDLLGGFSVGGLSPELNAIVMDGAPIGSGGDGGVPEEGIRMSRVITNTYDVARGQFAGGQISVSTRGGTNTRGGSLSYTLQDRALQWNLPGNASDGWTQHRWSGGFGGPIVRDRLLYFVSGSMMERSDPLHSLNTLSAGELARLGADPDSVGRFFDILGAHAIPGAGSEGLLDWRTNQNLNAMARIDWMASERHSVMARLNHRAGGREGIRTGPLALATSGGETATASSGALAAVTSRFDSGLINELRVSVSTNSSETDPYAEGPAGRVRVFSPLDDGGLGVANLTFGASSAIPSWSRGTSLDIANESSLLLGGGRHRVKFGGQLSRTTTERSAGSNLSGTFVFDSLDDLETGRPSLFTRTLAAEDRISGGWNGALYLGNSWRPQQRLQVIAGLRAETSGAPQLPPYNAAVDSLFQRRTDRLPSEVHLAPRVGFSWMVGGGEGRPPSTVIRGGIGAFRSAPPFGLFAAAVEGSGVAGSTMELVCVGDEIPTFEWAAYAGDPGAIPGSCLDGGGTVRSGRSNAVTLLDESVGAARSWRASIGIQRRLLQVFQTSADLTLTDGVNLHGVRDLNLVAEPAFRLADEGGRPVFVDADAILAGGTVPFRASRQEAEFGNVLEVFSGLRSRDARLEVSASGFLPFGRNPFVEQDRMAAMQRMRERGGPEPGMFFRTSYTISRTVDQAPFIGSPRGGLAPTRSGNPNDVEWGTGDRDVRHSFTATLGARPHQAVNVSLMSRFNSGRPFTPLVGQDISGDGARNNAAFVFDPATAADPSIAAGMQRVMASAPERIRDCLGSQMGTVAERNSCRTDWTQSVDLRTSFEPELPRIGRRLSLSMDLLNLPAAADRVLHGTDDLRGWGQRGGTESVLLQPVAFDRDALAFRYEVNELFGQPRQQRALFGSPFQVRVSGRLMVGPQRGMRGGGAWGGRGMGGGAGAAAGRQPAGGAAGAAERGQAFRGAANPARQVLELRDTLVLTEAQVAAIEEIADSLAADQERMTGELRERARGEGDRAEGMAAMRRAMGQAVERRQAALEAVREVLTPEQWEAVPEEIRNPRIRMDEGVRRGERGEERPTGERRGGGRPPQ